MPAQVGASACGHPQEALAASAAALDHLLPSHLAAAPADAPLPSTPQRHQHATPASSADEAALGARLLPSASPL